MGQIFKECAKSCESSCGSIHEEISCAEECIPGCTCPEGEVMGYDGICVKVEDCPCFFDDQKYLPSESHMQVCHKSGIYILIIVSNFSGDSFPWSYFFQLFFALDFCYEV